MNKLITLETADGTTHAMWADPFVGDDKSHWNLIAAPGGDEVERSSGYLANSLPIKIGQKVLLHRMNPHTRVAEYSRTESVTYIWPDSDNSQ